MNQEEVNLQAQNEILKQSVAIHEQLTRMVLNGEDMSTIACTAGKIIGGTVIVEDQFFRPYAYFSPTMTTEKEQAAQASFSARDIFSDLRHRHLATTLIQEKRSVLLPAESAKKPFSRLIYPITVSQEILGYVTILKTSCELTELDQMTLECMVTVFALKMMQDRAVAEVETRFKGDFVDELIAGNFNSEVSIIERARYIGYNLNQPHQVMVINIDNFMRLFEQHGQDKKQFLHFKKQLCEAVSLALDVYSRRGMITAKSDNFIVLTALEENEIPSGTVDLAQNIQMRINRQFSHVTVSIGIGRICYSPRDFYLSYQEAQRALKVIKGLNQNNVVISFDRLGILGLLFNAANQQDLLVFMQEQLGELLKYDARHKSQLVETLHFYFSCDGNVQNAARAAAVTPSGFKYRIGKICEIGGFSLKEPNKRFDLEMALKIWCITKACENRENITGVTL
ncbi:MAG: Purine catabolism regulatory protein [Pelotomaculum sp. PtaB.Bin013]|uniref:Helix-turn-helix domain-containing protein n=1 Tax=Pelotomaculum isophthalicicum JI TaxID=947010 RepID=A0A9X4JV41_9FIRM|nr:helix-turn-helix domain-containing protein [Pelotomaculum isophthalicicum]MDF9406838.1 helix-turn-helix domain-containing protein [Pelotomaculum isophthalicicum JI]OPX89658.1 MAG: Purine catabolism regulatory protein [Pelotomaculum sp. PtaB.Bin013]